LAEVGSEALVQEGGALWYIIIALAPSSRRKKHTKARKPERKRERNT
jgi:hypothetical protein